MPESLLSELLGEKYNGSEVVIEIGGFRFTGLYRLNRLPIPGSHYFIEIDVASLKITDAKRNAA